MSIVLDGDNGITTPTYGGTDTSEYLVPVTAFKNRIINGAMMIAQRGTSSISVSTDPNPRNYPVDRFFCSASGGGVYSTQQSSTSTAGFANSIINTVTTADSSIAAGDVYYMAQGIEGYNMADFNWGSANAATVTLSFWVRSSVTGTFSGSFRNSAANRAYVFTYTISAANTWEQKSVTITGDTSGTWDSTTSAGAYIAWDLGSGTNFNGTASSWTAGNYLRASTAVNWIATSGATFYITGVQLEKGSTATSFDYRPYGTELQLCQRYYQKRLSGNSSAGIPAGIIGLGVTLTTTSSIAYIDFRQTMRASPTVTQSNMIVSDSLAFDAAVSAISNSGGTGDGAYLSLTHATATAAKTVNIRATTNTAGFIAFDSEL